MNSQFQPDQNYSARVPMYQTEWRQVNSPLAPANATLDPFWEIAVSTELAFRKLYACMVWVSPVNTAYVNADLEFFLNNSSVLKIPISFFYSTNPVAAGTKMHGRVGFPATATNLNASTYDALGVFLTGTPLMQTCSPFLVNITCNRIRVTPTGEQSLPASTPGWFLGCKSSNARL